MANPLSGLTPALKVLAQNVDILPATGQAVEDLLRPDQEEVEDTYLMRDDTRIDTLLEAPNRQLYCPAPPLPRSQELVFRYFLDGSIRSHFIGTAVENERTTPVLIAQIGAAIVERDGEGNVHCARSKHQMLLLLAKPQVSDAVWERLNTATKESNIELVDICEEAEQLSPLSGSADLRARAGGVANARMRSLESNLAQELGLGDERGDDEWLIVDGSLRLKGLPQIPRTVAIAKSFSKQPQFRVGRGPRRQALPVTRLLMGLENAHRTAAFSSRNGSVAFWYIRLREQGQVEYPLMGVIKVELANLGTEPVPSPLVDRLSRALVAERHVTPHGRDSRWHVHLYPIYLAEQVIKNGFLSQEVIRSAIRWPMPEGVSIRR